ncbi:uncharacterized protein L201_004371 [Kwoniella dendrophila CBS 6074]|uniref:FAD-binding FR-type domain-containing protein n=1 Tax=Kwoniella dendrophila CBS 6074 TaxID=1295534 RepID=A0AAX4JVT2_9TREE
MSFSSSIQSSCSRCARSTRIISGRTPFPYRQYTSSSSSSSSSSSPNSPVTRSKWPRLALTLLGITIPTGGYFLFPSKPELTPHIYSNQPVTSTKSISNQHKLISVPIPQSSGSKEFFTKPYKTDGSTADIEGGEIVIQHMMIKSPDIQIERPYTHVNDPLQDNEVRMVVKRVRGGEVGRVVHNLKDGEEVGIRGPIPTFSIYPHKYDKIIMISTGTAISPFLQLLSKLPSSSTDPMTTTTTSTPKLHLIHSNPITGREDWSNTTEDKSFLPNLQNKFGENLIITRIEPGLIPKQVIVEALKNPNPNTGKEERIMVLICLPPMLMRPLCGNIRPNLSQGPITGVLGELGLTNDQVWKLE